MKGNQRPYRIIGAYDSETTNYDDHGKMIAFPILHQLGLLNCPIEEAFSDSIERQVNIELYRNSLDMFSRLDDIVSTKTDYVPVILCHNLAFDMYGLSSWLSRHDVRVLAKSARKPITFTVKDEQGNARLVIWDTLVFAQQSLERMGNDCGYAKASGTWDYEKVRTPETPLTDEELTYAKRDVYALLAWFGWWVRRNPDIEVNKLGLNVVTKTGVVRERRRVRFQELKGKEQKNKIGRYWLYRNRSEAPKTDDELFTMLACTRGGFTFCSQKCASVPFNLTGTDKVIAAYDATSQHPAQMVSHVYPIGFHEVSCRVLDLAFKYIGAVKLDHVYEHWDKPFNVAFNACFEFENLRPRKGSVYERFGVYPLASARYKDPEQAGLYEDNGDKAAYDSHMHARSYCDSAVNPVCAFGKLVSAEKARLYITELTAFEIWQAYEWDDVKAVHGYMTGRFSKPSDMDVISVMQFYKAKNSYKEARSEFYKNGKIDNGDELKALGVAPAIVEEMEQGTISSGDVEACYMSLKADLNSLYGINCTNAYRRSTVLTSNGIEYEGDFGIVNKPKTLKVWYQFGQRIVGWSRIAQLCAIDKLSPYALNVVNGDTDSIKIVIRETDLDNVSNALHELGNSIDKGKARVCVRVKYVYPELFDELEQIGYYVCEHVTDRFCASWNKAYCTQDEKDGKRAFSFTLAGIPTRKRQNSVSSFIGVNGYADRLYGIGWSFEDICNLLLGYNVTYAHDLILLNARSFPQWGDVTYVSVADYLGNESKVVEPCALALYPMSKTVNDTLTPENGINAQYARANNPNVNLKRKLLVSSEVIDMEGFDYA